MEKQVAETPQKNDAASSLELIAILNRRKAWLVLSGFLGLALGGGYYFLSPKRYESRAELLLMQNDSEPMSASGGVERDVSEELLSTHMKLVQSSRIVKKAVMLDVEAAKTLATMEDRPEDGVTDSSGMVDSGSSDSTAAPATDATTPSTTPPTEQAPTDGAAQPALPTVPENIAPPAPAPSPISANTDLKQNSDLTNSLRASPQPDPVANDRIGSASEPPATVQPEAASSGEVIQGLSPTEAISGVAGPAQSSVVEPGKEGGEIVMEEEPLSDNPIFALESIQQHLGPQDNAVEYVINNMYVTTGGSGRARNARVLNIAFRHTSPQDCEIVTRAIVDSYQKFVREKFKDINSEAAGLIEQAQKNTSTSIKGLEESYRKFRMESPMLSRGSTGSDIYTTRYEELAAEFSQLAIQRDEAAGRLDMVKKSLADYSANNAHNLQKLALIDERNAERLGILVTVERGKAETAAFQSTQPERMAGATAEYSQLLTMKTRLSQLTADFGPEYPEVKALRQQIGEMEGFLSKKQKELFIGEDVQLTPDDVMKAYVSMLEHDLRALDQRSRDIEKQMAIAEVKAKELVDYQLTDESMVRALEREEALYDAVIERLRDINMKKDSSPLILELIQEPTTAEKVEPKSVIAAAISLLCAFVIGGAGVLVAELRDRSVHSPEEFEEMLGSRVLAHLPNFQNDAEIRKVQRSAKKSKSPLSPALLTYYAPDSRASETFRALRTQVMFCAGGDHKILATTSANQGAGKSMISSNMAISMAGLGAEVLLIDCDMRLPQVNKLFGVSNEKGFAAAIVDADNIDDYLIPSGVPNLTLLPSGQAPTNPAELLSSPECKELLEKLRSRFAFIILDCPPVLAVSDPTILAPLADGVLFVSVVDGESRPKTMRSKRILEGVGANIIGIVVNRSDESTQRYGYQAYGYESSGPTDSYYTARPAR